MSFGWQFFLLSCRFLSCCVTFLADDSSVQIVVKVKTKKNRKTPNLYSESNLHENKACYNYEHAIYPYQNYSLSSSSNLTSWVRRILTHFILTRKTPTAWWESVILRCQKYSKSLKAVPGSGDSQSLPIAISEPKPIFIPHNSQHVYFLGSDKSDVLFRIFFPRKIQFYTLSSMFECPKREKLRNKQKISCFVAKYPWKFANHDDFRDKCDKFWRDFIWHFF